MRSIAPATPDVCAVGKHGLLVFPVQQNWLMPPLLSRHPPPDVVLWQAGPVHVALQRPP